MKTIFNLIFIAVSIIVVGIIIYTNYDSTIALGLTTTYYDSNTLSDDSMIALANLDELQEFVREPANGFDIKINNSEVFFEMLCSNSGVLNVEHVNGVFVNTITVDHKVYTVDPDLIKMVVKLCRDNT